MIRTILVELRGRFVSHINGRIVKKTAKQKHEKLSDLIRKHNFRYHVLDEPEISDEVYDSLMRELLGA